MTKKTWLEVALNGAGGHTHQHLMPITPERLIAEAVACVEAGASIIHFHSYDGLTETQKDTAELYARVIEGIRERVDAIVYGTLPMIGTQNVTGPEKIIERHTAMRELAEHKLIEWMVVDPGSVNFGVADRLAQDRDGFTYHNPDAHIRHGLAMCERFALHPTYAIYEPGFIRQAAAMAERFPILPEPIYRLMFSEGYTFGFPPKQYGLDAYLALLDDVAPGASWMVAGLMVNIHPLIAPAVDRGGHIRVGLEDAPRLSERGNLWWVEDAVKRIEAAGGTLATAEEVRLDLIDNVHD
ncbi:MAG: 3-keto-5-aminohexanoate cleavage protein [Pseudomonadota bacterium]|nr:3-keto-5-aminohexanoate cleavage protein [Pseudomonadota bacterium]